MLLELIGDARFVLLGEALFEWIAPERQTVSMAHHPPILMVPDVLSADECR